MSTATTAPSAIGLLRVRAPTRPRTAGLWLAVCCAVPVLYMGLTAASFAADYRWRLAEGALVRLRAPAVSLQALRTAR